MQDDPKPEDELTGLPEDEHEPSPLGTDDDEDAPEPGPDAMPGIVTDGSPPDAG